MRRSPEFPAGMAVIPLSFAYPMLKFIAIVLRPFKYRGVWNIPEHC